MKKFLAVTLTLALTLALFAFPIPANAVVTTQNTTNVLFEDNFDSYTDCTTAVDFKGALVENGFQLSTGNGEDFLTDTTYTHNDKFTVPNGSELYASTGNVEGSDMWSEYSVSVDVTYDAELAERSTNSYAMVVLNVTGVARGGYEFGINYTQTNGARLLFRRANSSEIFNDITYKTANTDIVFGEDYNLKLTYNAGIVYAYIDDVLFASHNTANDIDGVGGDADNILMLKEGPAGFRKRGKNFQISFDNFKVEKSEKTVWFNEDFSYESVDEMNAAGWDISSENYASSVNGGAFAWNITSPYAVTLANRNETAAWNDYSVEADFTVGEVTAIDETVTSTNQIQYFGLLGRVNGDKGYECSVSVSSSGNMAVRIRKDTTYLPSADDKSVSVGTYEAGATYNLKMEFIGNTINCYFNGILVRTVTDDTYTKGTVGLKMFSVANVNNSATVTVDNLKVTGYTPVIEYFKQTFDSNTTASNFTETGYTIADSCEMSYFTENKLILPTEFSGTAFYSPKIDSYNYTVETEFEVNSTTAAVTHGIIVGLPNAETKSTTNKTAYIPEARINKSGEVFSVRIRKIGTSGTLANAVTENAELGIAANAEVALSSNLPMGAKVKLSVTVSYDEMTETSVIKAAILSADTKYGETEYSFDGELSGYAALRKNASTFSVSYDNFKAYSVNTYVSPTIGELDGDGIVTAADGRYIREYLLGLNDATAADLNDDTASDIRDLIHFKKVFEFYN